MIMSFIPPRYVNLGDMINLTFENGAVYTLPKQTTPEEIANIVEQETRSDNALEKLVNSYTTDSYDKCMEIIEFTATDPFKPTQGIAILFLLE